MRVDFDTLMATNLSQLFLVLHEVRLKMPDVLVLVLLLGKKEPDLVFRYHLCKDETKYEQGAHYMCILNPSCMVMLEVDLPRGSTSLLGADQVTRSS